jgi:hypothetical protein
MTASDGSLERIDKLAAVLVFLGAFVLLFLGMNRAILIYDEGIILTAAMRVAAGDVPHRDFYANYGPAQFYLLAWLFDLFGQRVIVERLLDLAMRAATLAAIYSMLAAYCKRPVTLVVTAVCAIWLWRVAGYAYPAFPALLLAIVGSTVILKALFSDHPTWLAAAAGVITGLITLFRYDIGFLVFTAHALAVVLITWLSNDGARHRLEQAGRLLLPYAGGVALIAIPLFGWYWSAGALGGFIHDMILYPSKYYAATRSLPFPGILGLDAFLRNLVIYLPILVLAMVIFSFYSGKARLAASFRASVPEDFAQRRYFVFLIVFGLLASFVYVKGIVRVGALHLILSIVPSYMVLAALTDKKFSPSRPLRAAAAALVALSCAAALYVAWGHIQFLRERGRSALEAMASDHVRPTKIQFMIDHERAAAINFVRQNTKPDDRLYVGLTRHDKIFINDNFTYFAASRLPATKWHHFDPGLQTRADIQSSMIEDLERFKPPYAILESTWNNMNEPNQSVLSSGVTLLDDYFQSRYQMVESYGSVSIWRRK